MVDADVVDELLLEVEGLVSVGAEGYDGVAVTGSDATNGRLEGAICATCGVESTSAHQTMSVGADTVAQASIAAITARDVGVLPLMGPHGAKRVQG